MRKLWFVGVLVMGLAAAGCASPPQADIDAAKAALNKASAAGAAEYAADSLKAAQDAQTALDAELKAQADKFALFRSYTKAAELAKAPKGKGTAADLEAMKGDLAGAETSINDATTAMGAERYLEAKAKAEAAKNAATKVSADIQAAIEAKKGAKPAAKK
jgi:hypothetical protein